MPAAKEARTDWRTAKRAWHLGWPGRVFSPLYAGQPMKEIVEQEQVVARGRMKELEAETARLQAALESRRKADLTDKARNDATESRVAEGQMVRLARGAATQLLGTLMRQAAGASKIGARIQQELDKMASDTVRLLTPADVERMVRMTATLTGSLRQINDAAARSMEMERMLLGEPTKIIGIQLQDMTTEEAERRVAAASRALSKARLMGLLSSNPAETVDAAFTKGVPRNGDFTKGVGPDADTTEGVSFTGQVVERTG